MEILMLSFIFEEVKLEYKVEGDLDGMITGVVFLGMFLGAILWGFFSDRYGRKKCYMYSILLTGTMGMLSATSPNITVFMLFRFLVGFGFGGSHTAYTLWQEFTPVKSRARALLLNQLFWTVGALAEAGLAWHTLRDHGWRYLMVYSSILPFIIFLFNWSLPESPRFLIVKGRHDAAAQILRDVARANGHEFPEHCVLVLPEHHREDENKANVWSLFHPVLLFTTVALFFIWAADTFTYYGSAFITPKFFEDSSVYSASMYTTLAELPGVLIPMATINYFGRKGTLGMLFCISAVFFLVTALATNPNLILVSLCIARMASSAAFTVTFIYTSEVYPTIVRSTGIGIASAISRLSGFATSYVATGFSRTSAGFIYTAVPLLAAMLVIFMPYETANRPMFDSVPQMLDYDAGEYGKYKGEEGEGDTIEGNDTSRRRKPVSAKKRILLGEDPNLTNRRRSSVSLSRDDERTGLIYGAEQGASDYDV